MLIEPKIKRSGWTLLLIELEGAREQGLGSGTIGVGQKKGSHGQMQLEQALVRQMIKKEAPAWGNAGAS